MSALIGSGRLRRVVRLDSGDVVEYLGSGMGWQGVFVNGELASIEKSFHRFVPHLDFEVAGKNASVDVSAGLTMRVKRFRLVVGGNLVYADSDARPPAVVSSATEPPVLQIPDDLETGDAAMRKMVVAALISFLLSVLFRFLAR